MAKKITIDIEVNGKMQKATVSAKKLNEALKNTETSAHSADRRLKGAAQASANGSKNFSKMAQGITGGLVPAYATLAANIFAVSAAFNFLKRAGDFKLLQTAQSSYFASTGTNLVAISNQLSTASNGFLKFEEAAQAAAIGAAKGFTVNDLTGLAEGALKASAALGRSFQDTFDRLIRGVSKAEPELLDELGIVLRLKTASENFARANNKAVDSLTAYEKGRAVLEEVEKQLNDNFGAIDAAEIKNPFAKLAVTFDKLIKDVSQGLLPVFEGLANIINRSATAAIAVFGLFSLSIIKAGLPLEDMKGDFDGIQEKINSFSTNAKANFDKVQAEAEQTKKSFEGLKASASIGVQRAAAGAVDKGSKSKLLQKAATDPTSITKKDQAMLKRSLEAAKRQYEKFGKVKSTIFKNFSQKELLQFEKDLKLMNQKHMGFIQKQKLRYKNLGATARLAASGTVSAFAAAGKGVVAAGKGIGKGLNKALALTGIIGIISLVASMLKELLNNTHGIILSILGVIDKVITSGPGQAIATVMKGILTGVKLFFNNIAGTFATMIEKVLGVYVFALDALGFDDTAEKLKNIAEIPGNMVKNVTSGLDSAIESIDKAASGQNSFVMQYAGSDFGQGMAERDASIKKTNEENAAFKENINTIDALAESFTNLAEKRKEVSLTSFQSMMAGHRAVTTSGISSVVKTSARTGEGTAKRLEQAEALKQMLIQAEAVGGPLAAIAVNFRNVDLTGTEALNSLLTQLEAQEKASGAVISNYKDFEERLLAIKNQGAEPFGSIEGLRGYKVELEALNKAMKDAAVDSSALAKMQKEFETATGETFEDRKAVIDGLVAEQDRLLAVEQQNKLAAVDGQALTGFSKEAFMERLKLKELETSLDRVNFNLAKERALFDAEDDIIKKANIQARIDALIAESELLGKKVTQSKDDIKDVTKLGKGLGESLQSNMQSAFQSLVDGTKSAKEAFASMAQSILKDIAAMITKMLVLKLLESTLGTTTFGKDFLGLGEGKTGGIFSDGGKVSGYSTGGIAKGPGSGYPAILHGTEAVVPLPNGKAIPVDMKGAGQENNVTVNVAIDSNGTATQDSQADSNRGADLGSAIAAVVQKELLNQKRAGGILNPMGVS